MFKSMVNGVSGPNGRRALLPAAVLINEEPDHVIILPHNLVVMIVQVMFHRDLKIKDAMKTYVRVYKYFSYVPYWRILQSMFLRLLIHCMLFMEHILLN